jgi:hypothetical protein
MYHKNYHVPFHFRITLITWPTYFLPKSKPIIGSVCEGASIRSIERMTGVHRGTIMCLGVKVGQGCMKMMDANLRNLTCTRLEMDEIWGLLARRKSTLDHLTILRRAIPGHSALSTRIRSSSPHLRWESAAMKTRTLS